MRKSQLQNYNIIEDTHQVDFPKLSNLFPNAGQKILVTEKHDSGDR